MLELDKNIDTARRSLIKGALTVTAVSAISAVAPVSSVLAANGRTTDTVRVTYGRGGLPLISKQRGEFEKALAAQGIKVQWVGPFPNHAPSLQAVTGGSADFGFWGSSTPALAAIIAGSPLVFTQFATYEPRSTSIIVKPDSGINSVRDLVGKSVAVNRSGLGEFLLVAALEKNGVDRSKVRFVYLNPPDAAPAFIQSKVDAWSMWSPQVDIAREQTTARDIFLEGRDLDFVIDFSSLLTTRTFAEQNPALVRAVIDAYAKDAAWINTHTLQAQTYAQNEGGYVDAVRDKLVSYKQQWEFHEVNDKTFLEKFQFAADWLSERKILPQPVKVTDHLAGV